MAGYSVTWDRVPTAARVYITVQIGVFFHCVVLWSVARGVETQQESCQSDGCWWLTSLFLHEAWIAYQHANVLLNPLCQHLDRKYGIALLRAGQHWAIAGTLAAYWSREMLSLFLCLPYLTPVAQYLSVYALIYHLVKTLGVSTDAARKWSPPWGIMRIVIDRFYTDSWSEKAVSLGRIFLQGSDTAIHIFVLRDLYKRQALNLTPALHLLFVLWVSHAALNQATRKSTATLMVEMWRTMTCGTTSVVAPPVSVEEQEFIVRKLLEKREPHTVPTVKTSSSALDAMVTFNFGLVMFAMLMLVFVGEVPLRAIVEFAANEKPRNMWLTSVFMHEMWVLLQHGNVLANPRCQRLDRRYGIKLLKDGQHWAIAGTLAGYWSREVLGMFLCLPFANVWTQYLVLYSAFYHLVKSLGVAADAAQRWSAPWGIMRIVIDHFYLHSWPEIMLTIGRVALQGSDTLIHALLVRDLYWRAPTQLGLPMHLVFGVWATHAALNQWTGQSTATVIVEVWRWTTGKGAWKCPSVSADDEYVVRNLLGKPPAGEPRASTVRVSQGTWVAPAFLTVVLGAETGLVLFVALMLLVLREAPFQVFVCETLPVMRPASNALLVGFLHEAWLVLNFGQSAVNALRRVGKDEKIVQSGWHMQWASACVSCWYSSREVLSALFSLLLMPVDVSGSSVLFAAAVGTGKVVHALFTATHRLAAGSSTEQAARKSSSCTFPSFNAILTCSVRYILAVSNLIAHASVLRSLHSLAPSTLSWHLHWLSFLWVLQMLFQKTLDGVVLGAWRICIGHCSADKVQEPARTSGNREKGSLGISIPSHAVSDFGENNKLVVFYGHPAAMVESFSLFFLPEKVSQRWQSSPWMYVALPVMLPYLLYGYLFKEKVEGVGHWVADDVSYAGVRMQTWVANHFGRHFNPRCLPKVRRHIQAAAQTAENIGADVFCLGALNKAEAVNNGGSDLLETLPVGRKTRIVHGNHLTAAAVVETAQRVFGRGACIFLTGASSKIGSAVAATLQRHYGFDVLCHSSSDERCTQLRQMGLSTTQILSEGVLRNLWIVGKYDERVCDFIPHGATVIVFSVPNPFTYSPRPDVEIIEGATLRLDPCRLENPRVFANLLAHDEIFACNAAALVHAARGAQVDEVGPVDPNALGDWLRDAETLGLSLPVHEPRRKPAESPKVVVVGGGPAGLATAASLRRRGISCVVLEMQQALQGSWLSHFSGLEVTTRRDHCGLPGFPMPKDAFPSETIDGSAYVRYLQMYAARFAIDVRLNAEVKEVQEIPNRCWRVVCASGEEFSAGAVVIATGCHREARRPKGFEALASDVAALHSTELRGAGLWQRATKAALNGELLLVGFGNSASDISAGVLRCANAAQPGKARVHVSVRRVPSIIPRQYGVLRAENVAWLIRKLPAALADAVVGLFAKLLGGCPDKAFPSHLPRAAPVREGRIPVIDKYGTVCEALRSGQLCMHGRVREIDGMKVCLEDALGISGLPLNISMVVFCTGYEERPSLAPKPGKERGLYHVGFSDPWLLPLRRIGEEAEITAAAIATRFA